MTTESPEQQRQIDEAINTKGFLEFMTAHSGSRPEDINDPKLVAERFETFKRKEEVKKEVLNIFGEQIEKDFDIRLDAKDKESIGAYIDKQAIEDPKKLEKLRDLIGLFRTLPNQIANLTSQIKNLGTTPEQIAKQRELESDLEKMELVKEGNRWSGTNRLLHRFLPKKWGGNEEIVKNTQELVGKHGAEIKSAEGFDNATNKIKAQIAEIEKNLELTGKLEDAQDKFDTVRNLLLRESSEISELVESIKKRVKEKLEGKLKSSDTSTKSAGTQEEFAKFVQTSVNTETNITPLTQEELNAYQKRLNDQIEKQVSAEIMEFFTTKIDASSTNRFSKLEKYIEPYINLDKLGSGDKEKARAIIKKALTDSVASIDKSPDSDIRRMMVARIIAKYNL
jgi:hypothetical protein